MYTVHGGKEGKNILYNILHMLIYVNLNTFRVLYNLFIFFVYLEATYVLCTCMYV